MALHVGRVLFGHRRVFATFAIMAAVYVALSWVGLTAHRAIVAWDAGVLGFLLLTSHLFLTVEPATMPALAEAQEDGEWTIFWITLLASLMSFFAVTSELSGLKDLRAPARILPVVLVAGTLMLSWLFAHVVFALRYAHEWYETENGELQGGLKFPSDPRPDYMDFLYFSLVLGMTFQVSDVQITSRRLRRLAVLHGLVSFLYNTIIVALTVNIAAGLLS
jgi:uncharacterized membrane protein